jgi:uroporphyrin-III C-methyltransferase
MAPALLTAVNSTDHIHLIIGSNALAGARCSRSIEVGARPKLVAQPTASIHYGITKRIEEGQVEWIKRSFQDSDLTGVGRGEVDGVVDAVFITLGAKDALSALSLPA